MRSLALFLLLGCLSTLAVEARSNNDDMDESITKAKNKFHSYQSDPINLLRGIGAGEYDQIYIQYHRCVWSEYESDDDGEDSGCNGDGDGDNSWYMGNTQCYRANVAYSLYGVQAGEEVPASACRKKYYINSFFTKNGMQDLGSLLGLENYGDATSQCTLSDDGNDGQDENNNNSFQHNVQLYPNAQSYTTYCSSGKFITAMFSGAYCTGKGELELLNALTDLNDELDQVDCVLAYSADNYENNRRFEEEESGDEDEGDEEKSIYDLLSYSNSCSILEYPKVCPDPYGVKKSFDVNPRFSSGFLRKMHGIDWLTLVLFVLGTFLLLLTCCIDDEDGKKERRAFGFRRGRSKSPFRSRGRSKSPARNRGSNYRNSESDTVDSNGDNVNKKRRGIRSFFTRKK